MRSRLSSVSWHHEVSRESGSSVFSFPYLEDVPRHLGDPVNSLVHVQNLVIIGVFGMIGGFVWHVGTNSEALGGYARYDSNRLWQFAHDGASRRSGQG